MLFSKKFFVSVRQSSGAAGVEFYYTVTTKNPIKCSKLGVDMGW